MREEGGNKHDLIPLRAENNGDTYQGEDKERRKFCGYTKKTTGEGKAASPLNERHRSSKKKPQKK